MAMRPPMSMPSLSRRGRIIIGIVVGLIVLVAVLNALGSVYVNWLWFGSVDRRSVYSSVLGTRAGLFFGFGIAMAFLVALNIVLAYRIRPKLRDESQEQQTSSATGSLEPRRLLVLSIVGLTGLFAGFTRRAAGRPG